MTLAVRAVLRALLSEPDRDWYGLQIIDVTGLPPGTVHPILLRLEAEGWLHSWWEQVDPRAVGRPRRRYYRFTSAERGRDGAVLAREALAATQRRVRPARQARWIEGTA